MFSPPWKGPLAPTSCGAQLKYENCRHSSSVLNETAVSVHAGSTRCTPYCCTSSAFWSASFLHMSTVNSSSTGCRAAKMAGKFLSGSGRCSAVTTGQQQGRMRSHCQAVSSTTAHMGGPPAAVRQQDNPGYFSATDRNAQTNRNLIYRDVRAFLNEVGGDPREARYWLTQFQRSTLVQSPAFAVLEVNIC